MITYKDIKAAVNNQISSYFDAPIQSRDVVEGFRRPSFFTRLENNVNSSGATQNYRELTVRIYYFPTDRYEYSIEVLEVQEQLERIFDLKLPIKDRLININDTESVLTDGVLNFSFDIAFYDAKEVEFGNVICYMDENNDFIFNDYGNPITNRPEYPDSWTPVEVPANNLGQPIKDSEGNPMPIETMGKLYINKE